MKNKNLFKNFLNDPGVKIVVAASKGNETLSFTIPAIFGALLLTTGLLTPPLPTDPISFEIIYFISTIFAFISFGILKLVKRQLNGFVIWTLTGAIANIGSQVIIPIYLGYVWQFYRSQLLLGFLTNTVLINVIGVIVVSRKSLRREINDLINKFNKLESQREQLDENLATIDTELRTEIKNKLIVALEETNRSGVNAQAKAISALRTILNSVVRPTAAELDSSGTNEKYLQSLTSAPLNRVSASLNRLEKRFISELSDINKSALVSTPISLLAGVIFLLPPAIFINGGQGFLPFVVAFAVALWTLPKIESAFTSKTKLRHRLILLSIAAGALGLIYPALFFMLVSQITSPLLIPSGFIAIILIPGIFLLTNQRRLRIIERLGELNKEDEFLVVRLRQKIWILQSQLARVVHGQIQAKLVASALRLSKLENPNEREIDEIWSDIDSSISNLENSGKELSNFADVKRNLIEAWDGVCEIQFDVDQSISEALDQDLYARSSVNEILTESISNSMKHTDAALINVKISNFEIGYLELTVASVGKIKLADSVSTGYGSRMFDQLAAKWSLNFETDGPVLKATVPIKH